MELPVLIIILLVTLIILALAVYLISTISELLKINAGLAEVLEGLALKKTGPDAAGLVESCFPGEGQKFQQRVGVRGPIVAIGDEYPRGTATLNALLGVSAAAPAAPAEPAGRISVVGTRPWE